MSPAVSCYSLSTNIDHNNPEDILDGLNNLACTINKRYKYLKIIISCLLPTDVTS